MSTDTSTELLSVAQVCARYPGRGSKRLHPSTVTRWILTGCPSRAGVRVKLAAIRVGGRWMLQPAAIDHFFAALASTSPTPIQTHASTRRTSAQREQASARAIDNLERRGA